MACCHLSRMCFSIREMPWSWSLIPISQLAECLPFLLQPTRTDDVEIFLFLIYTGEMVVQSLKYLPRNLNSWCPPKRERPHNSVLGLSFCQQRLTALILPWQDGQADSEQTWDTNQRSFFPTTTQQPQKLQHLQGAVALTGARPEKGLLEEAIRY